MRMIRNEEPPPNLPQKGEEKKKRRESLTPDPSPKGEGSFVNYLGNGLTA